MCTAIRFSDNKTIYTGGFSSRTNTYYYNTYEDFSIRSVCLNDYMEESIKVF